MVVSTVVLMVALMGNERAEKMVSYLALLMDEMTVEKKVSLMDD
jgi:hypothetical protein